MVPTGCFSLASGYRGVNDSELPKQPRKNRAQ